MQYFILLLITHLLVINLMGADPGPNVNKNELDLVYQQDFDDRSTLDDFNFTKLGQWQWNQEEGGNGYLEIAEPNDYKPPVRSPRSIAVLNTIDL